MAQDKEVKKELKTVEAVCLRDSSLGLAGEVVTLSASDAQAGKDVGALDLAPGAIKAAKGK